MAENWIPMYEEGLRLIQKAMEMAKEEHNQRAGSMEPWKRIADLKDAQPIRGTFVRVDRAPMPSQRITADLGSQEGSTTFEYKPHDQKSSGG